MSKKIFISHSSKDKEIVNSFVENILIGALEISSSDIFNTSGYGTGIEPGLDWRQAIKENLEVADIVIQFDSVNYIESSICQSEIGAAEFMGKVIIPIIIPPLTFSDSGVLTCIKQIEIIDSSDGLDNIKDSIVKIMNLDANKLKTQRWNRKKREFLNDISSILQKKCKKRVFEFKDKILNAFLAI